MRQGVRGIRLKGLWIHPRSGLPYHRSQRGGKVKLTPLPPDLAHDDPRFVAAWAEAAQKVAPPPQPRGGSIAATWRAVLASDRVDGLATSTRHYITREAKAISAAYGEVKATAVGHRHIRADLTKCSNPGARWRAWRLWAGYCLEAGWLKEDPTAGVSKPKEGGGDGHRAWSMDEITAFRAAHPIGSTARAIMEAAYWTGARVSDVVLIGPQHVGKDGVLAFRQVKTKDMAYVPWFCPLPAYAAGMEADRALCMEALAHLSGGLTLLQTAAGRPRSKNGASNAISRACRDLGMTGTSIHGLRKARAVRLAEAGATAPQIGAWTGHRSLSEITHYIAEMDRRAAVIGTGTERETETSADPIRNQAAKRLK